MYKKIFLSAIIVLNLIPNSLAMSGQEKLQELKRLRQERIDNQNSGKKNLIDKNGFKDFKLQTSPDIYKKTISLLSEKGSVKIYNVIDKKYFKVSDVEISNINLFFYKNKLSKILISTKGLINSRNFLNILSVNYGKPNQPNEFIEDYNWKTDTIYMTYTEDIGTNDADIFIANINLVKLENQETQNNAEKAKNDL